MDTLDRLLVRDFFLFFILVLAFFVTVYLGIDFFSNAWGLDLSTSKVFQLYAYKFPSVCQQMVPVACLMGTLLVVANMSKQYEILALYASGIGPLRVASTFVAIVALVSTISFLVFDPIVPIFFRKQTLIKRGLNPATDPLVMSHHGEFWYRSGSLIYNVGRFIASTNTIENVNVFYLDSKFSVIKRIHAKRANFVDNDWVLEDGFTVSHQKQADFPLVTAFQSISGVISDKPADFKTLKVEQDMMRLKDLRRYISRNTAYGMDTVAQQVSYHERLALVFSPVILVLLGLPFGLKPIATHSMPKSIAFCSVAVFCYLLMSRLTSSMGIGGHIPPVLAGWIPNMVFLVMALGLLFRKW